MGADGKRLRAHGRYWLTQNKNGKFYIEWYDEGAQQTRRRSLATDVKGEAFKAFDRLSANAIGGDPRPTVETPRIATVSDLIAWYARTQGPRLAATGQTAATVTHVTAFFGGRSVSCLGPDAIERFVAALLGKNLSLGYAARIVAVLRAAVRDAHRRKLIPEAYDIPNPQSKAAKDATPRKGRPMSPAEIARLVDATTTRHVMAFIRLGLATAARQGAIFDLQTKNVSHTLALIYLNDEGRVQNTKYRPTVIAIEAIRPWLASRPPGYIVTSDAYPGKRINSIKTAWRAARRRASLDQAVTTYSLRYSVAMHMRARGVGSEEIAVQLGHVPVDVKSVTLNYAPHDPTYLRNAANAIAEFYAMVDALVTNPLWRE